MGERGGGRRGDLGRGGRRDIFCLGKKARRERVGACTSVQSQKQEMLLERGWVWEDAGAGPWTSPKWEGEKLELLPP